MARRGGVETTQGPWRGFFFLTEVHWGQGPADLPTYVITWPTTPRGNRICLIDTRPRPGSLIDGSNRTDVVPRSPDRRATRPADLDGNRSSWRLGRTISGPDPLPGSVQRPVRMGRAAPSSRAGAGWPRPRGTIRSRLRSTRGQGNRDGSSSIPGPRRYTGPGSRPKPRPRKRLDLPPAPTRAGARSKTWDPHRVGAQMYGPLGSVRRADRKPSPGRRPERRGGAPRSSRKKAATPSPLTDGRRAKRKLTWPA